MIKTYQVRVFRMEYGSEGTKIVHTMTVQADEVLVHHDSVSFQSEGDAIEVRAYGKEMINHVSMKNETVDVYILKRNPRIGKREGG